MHIKIKNLSRNDACADRVLCCGEANHTSLGATSNAHTHTQAICLYIYFLLYFGLFNRRLRLFERARAPHARYITFLIFHSVKTKHIGCGILPFFFKSVLKYGNCQKQNTDIAILSVDIIVYAARDRSFCCARAHSRNSTCAAAAAASEELIFSIAHLISY